MAKVFFSRFGSHRQMNREARGLQLLSERGVPAPVLLGRHSVAGGGGVLLIEYLDPAERVMERWQAVCHEKAGSAAQMEVLEPLFALVGVMHAVGLCQKDLHLDNFLWHQGQLKTVDGGGIVPCRGVRKQAANLGLLISQLPWQSTDLISKLLVAYQGRSGSVPFTSSQLVKAAEKQRHQRLKDYLAKTLRDSTEFLVRKNFFRFSSTVRFSSSWLAELVQDPDKAMESGTPLKLGGGTTVVQLELDGHAVVVKRYNRGNLGRFLKRCWRISRARKSWLAGHRLRTLGIDSPQPLALIEERWGILCSRSWLVTEYIDGVNIFDLMSNYRKDTPPVGVMDAFVTLFKSLYRARISHGDMKATNLVWEDSRIWLIDLDGMKAHRYEVTFGRAWKKDKKRFLRNWGNGFERQNWANILFSYLESI
ncbi:MAG: hypothetical protein JXB25_10705 [Deltaproteobacteria bacterium]|nr:hypothetical protein [Deltaproteobacteria bacterium]